MNWLAVDKHVWRRIFQILYDLQRFSQYLFDICTLRAVCRFMRDVSSIRANGERWVFYHNHKKGSYVRFVMWAPIRDWQRPKRQEDRKWLQYIKKRRPVFSKRSAQASQPLESISWCEPNERTKEKVRRSHHQKKKKSRGDFRRSGAMYEPWEHGGYIPQFCSPSEVEKNRPWVEIECVITDVKDVYGAVAYKKLSERRWKDPVTGVVHYRQVY